MIEIDPNEVHLTPREKEIMLLLVNGDNDKEAGIELGINDGTVNTHRSHALDKFGALIVYRPSIAEAVQIFLALGYIKNKFAKKKPTPATKK
jgi:DNA-binding CsgD family transcriptional regulator